MARKMFAQTMSGAEYEILSEHGQIRGGPPYYALKRGAKSPAKRIMNTINYVEELVGQKLVLEDGLSEEVVSIVITK